MQNLRRREAEAREAARRAARRAEEQRRRTEAIARRIAAANRVIAQQEKRFQADVVRLDEAARRLPDLTLRAATLPSLASGTAADPGGLEAYATHLVQVVDGFSREVTAAIAEAERLLQRRIAKAQAWRTALDLVALLSLRIDANRNLASVLREPFTAPTAPVKPEAAAELEDVQSYVTVLRKALDEADRQHASLSARNEARRRATALAGAQVRTHGATEAHDRHDAERMAAAQTALRARITNALSALGLSETDLPETVRMLVDDALAHVPLQDRWGQIERWIRREAQRRADMQDALKMMQQAPDFVHDNSGLSRRWTDLLAQLQRVADGLDDFTVHHRREYEQIQADARRAVSAAFSRADWMRAMAEQGFEIFDRDDGNGLVVIDCDHPETWLEVTQLESEQGGEFAAALELKTDLAHAIADEAAVTSAVCAKLAKVSQATGPDVASESQVVEHSRRITRAHRPVRARNAFAITP